MLWAKAEMMCMTAPSKVSSIEQVALTTHSADPAFGGGNQGSELNFGGEWEIVPFERKAE